LCRIATGALSADLVVLLDLSPEQGFDRMAGRRLDRIESEERDFHERVRGGYLHQARQDPERWQVVDASAAPEAISDSIWDRVQQKLMNRGLLK
jgi:dTMP kinase